MLEQPAGDQKDAGSQRVSGFSPRCGPKIGTWAGSRRGAGTSQIHRAPLQGPFLTDNTCVFFVCAGKLHVCIKHSRMERVCFF